MGSDLIGVTADLDPASVLAAYRDAAFPMGGRRMITWHRPPLRAVIPLDAFHVSRSLARRIRAGGFEVTFDRAFRQVMLACARREDTWIDHRIVRVYSELHNLGHAHSVEVWVEGALAGGAYGVHQGGAFFAESMFHAVTDMSKVALCALTRRLRENGFQLFDVQYLTPHLASLGAVEVDASNYLELLQSALASDRVF
jgi:leucyl/phenylalanyl-tRNA---protein transferase